MKPAAAPPPDFSAHLPAPDGFCRPDWEAIDRVIDSTFPEEAWSDAWSHAARQWLGRLRESFGAAYQVHESPNFLLLTDAPPRNARRSLKTAERDLRDILRLLGGVACDSGEGKHVALLISDQDSYYRYISYFYPDGDHPANGGLCTTGGGYVHFAIPTHEPAHSRTVLVHELTHACLDHLPLPAWLHEAAAMRMEEGLCGTLMPPLDRRQHQLHREWWQEGTIQEFWNGAAWGRTGDAFSLAYCLARILWRKIEFEIGAPRDAVLAFLASARHEDAGEAAFLETFGFSLGELVEDFLGPGDWRPDPERWHGAAGMDA